MSPLLLLPLLACKPEEEAAPRLVVDPMSVDFGTIALGFSSTAAVTLRNDGGGEVEILSASITEGDLDAWTLLRDDYDPLRGGDEIALAVSFTPVEEGDASATLQVRSDAPDAENTYISLTGTGGPSTADDDADGYSPADGDCDDGDAAIHPGADEGCDGEDTDCDGDVPADEADDDGDGVHLCDADCDDTDADVYPGAPELCDDLDDDCDGVTPDRLDADGDGFDICAGDCDDADAGAIPGGVEVCNGADDDCSGVADDIDADADGFSPCDAIPDCDDGDAAAHPVYVDDDGSENAAGTYTDPLPTLEAAWDVLDDTCRTIGVLDGAYAPALAVDDDLAVVGLGDVTLTPPEGARAFTVSSGATLSIETLTISGATNAEGDGGAIYADGARVDLDGVVLSGNTTAGDGGAIAINVGTLSLSATCALEGNAAGDDGGAVSVVSGSLEDAGAAWTGNAGRLGGALLLQSSAFVIAGATFDGNAAAQDGGAIYADAASRYTLDGLTLTRNTAAGRGGALALNDPGDGYARNLVVEDNAAEDGSGIAVTGSLAGGVVANDTIVSNAGGAALLVDVTDASGLYVWSNVVAFNDGTAAIGCAGGASVAYDLVYGTDSGTDLDLGDCVDAGENLVDDPLFTSFDDDGDPTDDDLAPKRASPARDSGPADGEGPASYTTWSDPDGSRNDRGHTGGPGGS